MVLPLPVSPHSTTTEFMRTASMMVCSSANIGRDSLEALSVCVCVVVVVCVCMCVCMCVCVWLHCMCGKCTVCVGACGRWMKMCGYRGWCVDVMCVT